MRLASFARLPSTEPRWVAHSTPHRSSCGSTLPLSLTEARDLPTERHLRPTEAKDSPTDPSFIPTAPNRSLGKLRLPPIEPIEQALSRCSLGGELNRDRTEFLSVLIARGVKLLLVVGPRAHAWFMSASISAQSAETSMTSPSQPGTFVTVPSMADSACA